MKQTSPRILVLIAAVFLLLLSLAGCGRSDSAPPKELWYLGGAPILDDFSTSGGISEPTDIQTDIVIYVPLNLVKSGFLASILGITTNGEEENLLLDNTLTPGEYYVISKDTYQKYESLTLHLEYSWQGQIMSMRVIDLLTHQDVVPVYHSDQS